MKKERTDPKANARLSENKEVMGSGQGMSDTLADFFASDPMVPPPKPPASFADKRPLRILITDDNSINRNVLRTIVERLGYSPIEASGGRDALDLLKKASFDLLFTDVDMPEMNGIELAKAVRAHELAIEPIPQSIEIVAVTANIQPETRLDCKRAGMNGFLEKPVDLEKIKKQILKSWRRIKKRHPET